jgi:hypothetical protein
MVKKFKLIDPSNKKQDGGTFYSPMSNLIPSNMVGAVASGQPIRGEKLGPNLSTLPLTNAIGSVPLPSSMMPYGLRSGFPIRTNRFPLNPLNPSGLSVGMPLGMPTGPAGIQVLKPALPIIASPFDSNPSIYSPVTAGPFIKLPTPRYLNTRPVLTSDLINRLSNISALSSPLSDIDLSEFDSSIPKPPVSTGNENVNRLSNISSPTQSVVATNDIIYSGVILIELFTAQSNYNIVLIKKLGTANIFGLFGGRLQGRESIYNARYHLYNLSNRLYSNTISNSTQFVDIPIIGGIYRVYIVTTQNIQTCSSCVKITKDDAINSVNNNTFNVIGKNIILTENAFNTLKAVVKMKF